MTIMNELQVCAGLTISRSKKNFTTHYIGAASQRLRKSKKAWNHVERCSKVKNAVMRERSFSYSGLVMAEDDRLNVVSGWCQYSLFHSVEVLVNRMCYKVVL